MPRGTQASPPAVRFEAGIDRNGPVPTHRPELGPCWVWKFSTDTGGYARFSVDGRLTSVHQWAYAEYVGPVPPGLELDHLCRNRRCANPGHLEPVTRRVNLMRGDTPAAANLAKTHCVNGHEFTERNTRWKAQGTSVTRVCRKCLVIGVRKWRLRKAGRI